jgi:hypothetical protein
VHAGSNRGATGADSRGQQTRTDRHRERGSARWHNTITVQAPFGEGIDANYVTGAETKGNTITGTGGYDAISLWGSTRSTLIANDVRGFTPDPTVGFAQIYLDPFAADNHVVCAGPGVTVLDEGTGNTATGCGKSNSKGFAHNARVVNKLRMKARLP